MNSPRNALWRLHDTSRCTLWCIAVLAMALAFSQTLGAMHRVVHAHQSAGLAGNALAVVQPLLAEAAEVSWLDALFSGHDTKSSCDQYDALSHADLAAAKICSGLMPTSPEAAASFHSGWQLAAQAVGFLARGPPAQV